MLSNRGELHRSPLDFDVGFVVYRESHVQTVDHTNRGFGCHGTVPDDMKHDGTVV
ncbi:hypothetical protein ACFLX1_00570 [Chloroflexota bacterium]